MEIILKEDIIGLGFKNDIVNVKSGYGRNYLIPQGKGVIASPMAKKILADSRDCRKGERYRSALWFCWCRSGGRRAREAG